MSNLAHRQQKIQEKRKQTPRRDFVMEICSWMPMMIYKNQGMHTRYADNDRGGAIIPSKQYSYDKFTIKDHLLELHFFDQVTSLFKDSTKMAMPQWYDNENCDFVDSVFGAKNCYLSFAIGIKAENVLYSVVSWNNITNVYNSLGVSENSEIIFSSSIVTNSFQVFYSQNIHNCNNIWFSENMIGCNDCIDCSNLENQSFCINNKQLTKEQYTEQKVAILRNHSKHKNSSILSNYASDNVQGQAIIKSHNISSGFAVSNVKQGHNNILLIGGDKGSESLYDCINVGNNATNCYAISDAGTNSSYLYCSVGIGMSSNIYYSYFLESCSFCLGCIGLKNKSYCILNKQYTKEERYEKVDEIFSQMDANGTLGEFFPASMNPFYFNDTAAYLIDPSFTKEEVVAKGYLWRDEPIKVDIPAGAEVVRTDELGQYEGWMVGTDFYPSDATNTGSTDVKNYVPTQGEKRHIDPSIIKKIIQDPEGNVYRIVPMEYEFLMKHGLPLPRKHWLDRMKENFRITS